MRGTPPVSFDGLDRLAALAILPALLHPAVLSALPAARVPVSSEDAAPAFLEGSRTTRSLAENTPPGTDIGLPVGAADADSHALTYALGGADADSFTLDSRSGQIRTRAGVDYDYEARRVYSVTVRAEDGRGGSAVIDVDVELMDEAEPPPALGLPTVAAATRTSLTIHWVEPDTIGRPEIRDYDGRFRADGDAEYQPGWDRVSAVTEATISGLDQDTDYEVQVRASSEEGFSDWSDSLMARTEQNRPPVFEEGASATRQIAENTEAAVDFGAPLTATDAEADRLEYSLSGEDASAFSIGSTTGQLASRSGVTYDYETLPEYSFSARVVDEFGDDATISVSVEVTDVGDSTIVADAGWDFAVAVGGTAPLDGRGSTTDQGELTYTWLIITTPGSSAPALTGADTSTPSFVADAEGEYVVRLTVSQGSQSTVDYVSVTAHPASEADSLVEADLLVDTNRDGVVNSSDEDGEETWTRASGAVFGPNADDDNGSGLRDAWDREANGRKDLRDMAPVVVRRIPGLNRSHGVAIRMTYTSTRVRPRLFYTNAQGSVELLTFSRAWTDLPLDELAGGDLQLYLESRYGRAPGFDGNVTLSLRLTENGTAVSTDTVALRGSPILFRDHLGAAERVFVMRLTTGTNSNGALLRALGDHLPASTSLYRLTPSFYDWDRWVQDFMQTGYTSNPTSQGATTQVHVQLTRGRGLNDFLPDSYLSSEKGYVRSGGSYYSSFNYGGNVEVLPPHSHDGKSFPLGRIVIGGDPVGGGHAMAQGQIDFLNSQKLQAPVLVVDTGWLSVSHVDEIFSVIPNRNAGEDERNWVVLIGSPDLAISLLEEAEEDGHGDVPIFRGRGWDETTASELLTDSELLSLNDQAQARIDTVRALLISEVGLEDSDFREVPALFEGAGLLVALVPSIQNLLVAGDVLLIPDPEGPTIDGKDIFRTATKEALDGLGLTARFVDVYQSYHVLLGALHCAVNVERSEADEAWWLHAEE